MNIGEAASLTGVSAKMIRYYEEIGLIAPAERSPSGYRHYGMTDVRVLHFIRRARDLGFSVEKIGELLSLWRDRSRQSADVKRLATEQIEGLEQRIEQLQSMVQTLTVLAEACCGDHRPDCPILEELGGDGDQGTLPAVKPSRQTGTAGLKGNSR